MESGWFASRSWLSPHVFKVLRLDRDPSMPAERILVRRRHPVRRALDVLLPDRVSFPLAEWTRDRIGLQRTFAGRRVKLTTTQDNLAGTFVSCDSNGVYLSVNGKDTYVPRTSLVTLEALD